VHVTPIHFPGQTHNAKVKLERLDARVDGSDAEREVLPAGREKAGLLDHVGKRLLVREALDGLDQVLIGIAVGCNDVAQVRDD
jgi:hypothetical protein